MYKIFKLFNKNEIKIVDEFFDKEKLVFLNKLTEYEFSYEIEIGNRYIYSNDKEILFTNDWDSFFFLLGTKDKEMMEKIISNNFFDGFLCDDKTTHSWDLEL